MKLVQGYKNKWYIRYKKQDGKPTMISCNTDNELVAQKYLVDFMKKNQPISVSNTKKMTLSKLFNYWLNNQESKYITGFKPFIEYFGNNCIVDNISKIDIDKYKTWRSKSISKTNSKKLIRVQTINSELRTLKALFNRSIQYDLISVNPLQNVKFIKSSKTDKTFFSIEEIKHIISNIQDFTIKNVVIFGFLTGCRYNEILNLEWSDIDLNDRVITIRNKTDNTNKVKFRTKNLQNRIIPINDDLMTLLTDMKCIGGYVFVKDNGQRFCSDYVSKQFKKIVRSLGYDDSLHFHSIRHSTITHLIKSGENIFYVQKFIGHSDVRTTLEYAHLNNEDLINTSKKLSLTK